MLERLDDIPWAELHHAYGKASDVPDILRSLASPVAKVREKAFSLFYHSVIHQGSKYEVSSHTVPFLIELVDADPPNESREDILNLLLKVALGCHLNDESLPFDPDREFQQVIGMVAADFRDVIQAFFGEAPDIGDDQDSTDEIEDDRDLADELFEETLNLSALACEQDCYRALEAHCDRLLVWAFDRSIDVAKLAVSAIPWFPVLHSKAISVLQPIVIEPSDPELRMTVLMTIALLPEETPGRRALALRIDSLLSPDLPFVERLVAAIAQALILRTALSEKALGILIDAERFRQEIESTVDVIPFKRTLLGYWAKALYLVGLSP